MSFAQAFALTVSPAVEGRPKKGIARSHGATAGRDSYSDFPASYRSWLAMKARCANKGNRSWANYGGRGIAVCPEWENDYEAFLAHVGEPSPGQTIDRIDVNKGYEPGNVRWADAARQARNTRSTVYVTVDGVTLPLPDMCDLHGLSASSVKVMASRERISHQEIIIRLLDRRTNPVPKVTRDQVTGQYLKSANWKSAAKQ